ncbi:AAA family ATPase [Fonticella tunisiensis]
MSSFESWEKAFMYLGKHAKNERLVVVIDEFPYIVNSNKSIPSLLQNLIDHHLKDTKLFLIICGSSMSFIESVKIKKWSFHLFLRR